MWQGSANPVNAKMGVLLRNAVSRAELTLGPAYQIDQDWPYKCITATNQQGGVQASILDQRGPSGTWGRASLAELGLHPASIKSLAG